ncbi:MAG: glycosyltransferase family 4 protein [Frankiaceae bacterium]|nr:glycosyltransferase family 4 protein [Frankiaceae bacterium]
MRVLMVHDEPIDGGYGAESYIRRLVDGLRAAGDAVEVVAGQIRHRGVGRCLDLWDPAARRLINDHATRFGPDVVHFHNIARELSGSVLSAARGVPKVMTVHDFRLIGGLEHHEFTPRGISERMSAAVVRRTAVRRLAATMGVSEPVSEALRAADFPAVATVRVPAQAPATPPKAVTECHDVAVVARLAPDKGVDVAIEGFEIAAVGKSRLLIAGDGPSRAELERRAAPLGDRVRFLGHLDATGVSDLLGRVRVVVVASQPSRRPEGSSLAMVEAAMHGRPVVATDDPAVLDVAASLGCVVNVPAADAGAIGTQLTTLLLDDRAAAELSRHGQANAERLHSVAAVTAAAREVYRRAIGR